MANVKFELNREGVGELLKSSEMQSILGELGQMKAAQAGEGYDSEVHVYSKRAVVNIFPATGEAARNNYTNNTLEKVIG